MIDYIVLAEFDDLKGRVIRYTYPKQIPDFDLVAQTKSHNSFVDRLAELMIPDTGNDRMIDIVYFMLNRPPFHEILKNLI